MSNLINKLERIAQTDVRYLISGGSWLLAGQALSFVFSFALMWVFANYLSKEEYGQYRFFLTAVSIISLTSLPGLNQAVIRAVARGADGILKPATLLRMKYALLGSLGSAIAAGYYYHKGNDEFALIFLSLAVLAPLIETLSVYTFYLQGKKDFRLSAILYNVQRFVVVIATIGAILWQQNVTLIILVNVVTTIALQAIALVIAIRIRPLNATTDVESILYGKHLSLVSIFRSFTQQVDKVLLWYLAGPAAVSNYTISVALPNEISSASGQVNNLAMPKMSEKDPAYIRTALFRKWYIFSFSIAVLVILYIAIAPVLFTLFFPQYLDVVTYTQVASLLMFSASAGLLYQYFIATKYTSVIYKTNIIEPVSQILFFILFIPFWGTLGAIIAVIARMVTMQLVYLYFIAKDTR